MPRAAYTLLSSPDHAHGEAWRRLSGDALLGLLRALDAPQGSCRCAPRRASVCSERDRVSRPAPTDACVWGESSESLT